MKTTFEMTKGVNEEGKEIVKEIKKTTILKEREDGEEGYESTFYYKVNEKSELYLDAKVNTVVLKITHLNQIDYKEYHEEMMIIDWALGVVGYDMVNDKDIWVKKLKEDKEFEEKLGKLLDTLIPITKEEYDNCNKESN